MGARLSYLSPRCKILEFSFSPLRHSQEQGTSCHSEMYIVRGVTFNLGGKKMKFCFLVIFSYLSHEPHQKKTCLWGFRPGPTQFGLHSHRRWLEALKFRI